MNRGERERLGLALCFAAATPCAEGFACEPSTGACAAPDLATHLLRSVDYQIVETVIASEAAECSPDDPAADAFAGAISIDVLLMFY